MIGFIPFGFCVYPWMKQAGARRPGLVTAGAGAAVSLAIETLQIFLPTRDSGTNARTLMFAGGSSATTGRPAPTHSPC